MWRTGSTFPLAVYSTSSGLRSGPSSRSVPSCSPCSCKAFHNCEISGLKLGGTKSSTGRPMIFSRGNPKSLLTPALASLELPWSSVMRIGVEG